MTPLWMYPEFYERVMEPDEEDAWAEHDRRCGHTPYCELDNRIFGGPGAFTRGSRKDGTPALIGDGADGLFSRPVEASPNTRDAGFSPDGRVASPSASGLLLLPLAARTRPSSDGKDAAA